MKKISRCAKTGGAQRALLAIFICSTCLLPFERGRAESASQPELRAKMHPMARTQPAASPDDPQAEVTVTVGVVNHGITGREQRLGGLRDVHFAYSVPTYTDGTYYTVYVPIPPGEDLPGTATPVHIRNLGGQVLAVNQLHVNLRFAITNWNNQHSASVTIRLGSQSKTAQKGATEIVFNHVPQTTLPLSITIEGILFRNGQSVPTPVPGLLPVSVNCPAVGTLRPRYHVLTVVYAPPGANGGRSTSSVDYGAGSSAGTTTSIDNVFKQGTDVKADASGSFFGGGGVSAAFSASSSTTKNSSIDIKKSQNYNIKVTGPTRDGIDHDADIFYVWLNPRIDVSIDSSNNARWELGVDGNIMDIQYVYAAWLKNPQLLPPGLQQKFSAAGLTTADYAQILSTDPFAAGITTINPLRYLPVDRSFPYIPPLNAQAAVPTQTFRQDSSVTHSASLSTQVQYGVTLSAFVSVGVPEVFTAKLSLTDSLQWTNTSKVGKSSTASESATVTIGGPAFGYAGPTDVLIYWDTVYHSFMFAFPTEPASLSGIVTNATGKPVPNKELTLIVGTSKVSTVTDRDGKYHFYGLPEGPGKVVIDDKSFEVTVEAGGASQTLKMP